MKKFKLPHDVYNCDIWFVRGQAKELQAFVAKTCPDADAEIRVRTGAKFLQYQRGGYMEYYILFLPNPKWSRAYKTAMLVHECAHLANSVLSDHGVLWDANNDEAYTYYLQWLVANCLWQMWGRRS
jgi:hypothetical protein